MSIAEFYIENGLGEDYGIDDWLRDQHDSLDGFGVGSVHRSRSGRGGSGGRGGSSGRGGSGGSFACSACGKVKPAGSFSKNQLTKGAKRRCVACVPGKPPNLVAGSKRPAECPPKPSQPAKRPAQDAAEFEGCSADIPRDERLARLRSILGDREPLKSYDADFPSVYGDQGFSMDKATTDIPEDWSERAALAKALVDYGEAVNWSKKTGYWKIECSGKPCGPPVVADLVTLATKSGDRYSQETAVNTHATRMLMLKGLMYRQDLISGNPAQAGPGLYGFRDPPLVKYARAGSAAMVALMIEFGANLEQCLMWNEDHDYKDYNWRGDTALIAAAKEGHDDVCSVLLARGANPRHTSMYDEDCSDNGAAAAARRCGKTQTAALIDSFSPSAPAVCQIVTALLATAHEAAQTLRQTPRAVEFSPSFVQGPQNSSSAGMRGSAVANPDASRSVETDAQKEAGLRARLLVSQLTPLFKQVTPEVCEELMSKLDEAYDDACEDADDKPGGGGSGGSGYGGGYGGYGGYGYGGHDHYGAFAMMNMGGAGGNNSSGGRGRFARKLTTAVEQTPGRLGALCRGSYVIVVACGCPPAYPRAEIGFRFCNCHVAIFWKDHEDLLHRDCEEMFKADLGHVIEELVPFAGGSYSEDSDAGSAPPATDLAANVVDERVAELAHLDMLRSEFWSGVRIFLEAANTGVDPEEDDLPACFTHFMRAATRGTVVHLQEQGDSAARTAIAALGGNWPAGTQPPSLKW